MDKNSIYKIIGYHGEYNASVKKAIRKLLKENHPDNKGDRHIFELINEVKEELENNKVSYNNKETFDNPSENNDVDYNYCHEMIKKLTNEKSINISILDKKKKRLSKMNLDYKSQYQNNIDLENYLLNNTECMKELNQVKSISVFLLIISIIVFIISIWKESVIFFIIFVILAFVCVLAIHNSFVIIKKITDNNHQKMKSYLGNNSKISNIKKKQDKLKKEINDIEKTINNIENDLRFYNNLLKK